MVPMCCFNWNLSQKDLSREVFEVLGETRKTSEKTEGYPPRYAEDFS
jgi:hypothetical protein